MSNVSIFPPIDHIWLYLCIVAVFEALAVYLYQFRKIPGAMPLFCNLVCKAFWVLSRVLCNISPSVPLKLFWINFSQWMLILIISLWFEFILDVSQQREKIPVFIRFGIRGGAACLLLTILFDGWLGWFWQSIIPYQHEQGMRLIFGPAAWATMWFCYLLNLFCLGLCVRWVLNTQGLRRWQAIALSVTPLFALSGNMLRRIPEFQAFAPQLMGLLLGGVYITWVFYRWRIYSILPLAREAVTRSMIDGLLAVDEKGYIVAMNPTATTLFSDSPVTVGGVFRNVAADWPDLARFGDDPEARKLETVRAFPDGNRHFRIDMIPLIAGNHLLGKVFVMKDITGQKQVQATLIEQQKALSVLAERERLGRELHDTQGQFPGYIKTQAQAIRLLLKNGRATDAAAHLEQLISAADVAYADVREAITNLKSAAADGDFFQKLPEWLNRFRSISGIATDYTGPEEMPPRWVAPEAETHLLRIIQEALTNARKHAAASRIVINLIPGDDRLTLTIADNGRGFDTQRKQAGFGLGIIGERAGEIGGTCAIRSAPETGTVVTVQVPLAVEGAGKYRETDLLNIKSLPLQGEG